MDRKLGKARRLLEMAYIKLLMAERVRRNKEIRRNLMLAAMIGRVPIMPETIANMYYRAAISDIKKARKKLEKILEVEESLNADMLDVLREVIWILSSCEGKDLIRMRMDLEKSIRMLGMLAG
ncbi:MAG: hypothetical protein DRN15_05020 [Thermoprotei archaeon]|nr:MAG: hypothetical protein DRM97_05735 [Thermoprotei archaeon]RLF23806.1 MAG: hypothetical protein DRN15_05020 [Thermoprotei archaeon]